MPGVELSQPGGPTIQQRVEQRECECIQKPAHTKTNGSLQGAEARCGEKAW